MLIALVLLGSVKFSPMNSLHMFSERAWVCVPFGASRSFANIRFLEKKNCLNFCNICGETQHVFLSYLHLSKHSGGLNVDNISNRIFFLIHESFHELRENHLRTQPFSCKTRRASHWDQVSKTHFEQLYIAPIPHFIIRWATFGSGIDFSGGGLSAKSCYFFCVSPQWGCSVGRQGCRINRPDSGKFRNQTCHSPLGATSRPCLNKAIRRGIAARMHESRACRHRIIVTIVWKGQRWWTTIVFDEVIINQTSFYCCLIFAIGLMRSHQPVWSIAGGQKRLLFEWRARWLVCRPYCRRVMGAPPIIRAT